MIYSFFGPPGCGKGTISSWLVENKNFEFLSTGNLCRWHIQEKTDFGKALQEFLDNGKLVPDDLVNNMVANWLNDKILSSSHMILDGYPRTTSQIQFILNLFKNDKHYLNAIFKVVDFNLDEKSIVERLTNRVVCSNKKCQAIYSAINKKPKQDKICDFCGKPVIKRSDDNFDVIKERLSVFFKFKKEMLDFYLDSGTEIINFIPDGTMDEMLYNFSSMLEL
jgi:adenylate kinase